MIKCPICGKEMKNLTHHIIGKQHNLSIDEFKKLYPNQQLVSDETRVKTGKSCKGKGRPKGIPMSEKQKEDYRKRFSGEGNPFYNKRHTKETKRKMINNHADFSGDNNPLRKSLERGDTTSEFLGKIAKDRWEELKSHPLRYTRFREKCSDSQSRKAIENPSVTKNHKHGKYFSEYYGKEFYYQSSYELDFIKSLENVSSIRSLERCKLRIPYFFEGITRKYNPDFTVYHYNGSIEIIEIKPNSLLTEEGNQEKFSEAFSYAMENDLIFTIITENWLYGDYDPRAITEEELENRIYQFTKK